MLSIPLTLCIGIFRQKNLVLVGIMLDIISKDSF